MNELMKFQSLREDGHGVHRCDYGCVRVSLEDAHDYGRDSVSNNQEPRIIRGEEIKK